MDLIIAWAIVVAIIFTTFLWFIFKDYLLVSRKLKKYQVCDECGFWFSGKGQVVSVSDSWDYGEIELKQYCQRDKKSYDRVVKRRIGTFYYKLIESRSVEVDKDGTEIEDDTDDE